MASKFCPLHGSVTHDFFSITRVLTQHWIAHALQQGDLGRIIDPLLLLLLHPATARVSIHYACSTRNKARATSKVKCGESVSADCREHPEKRLVDAKEAKEGAHDGSGDELNSAAGAACNNDVINRLESDVTGGKKWCSNRVLKCDVIILQTFPFEPLNLIM